MKKILAVVIGLIMIIGVVLSAKMYFDSKNIEVYPNMEAEAEFCPEGAGETEGKNEEPVEIKETEITVGYNVGQRFPNVELHDSENNVVNLYDMMEGKEKFIINLSADWCSDSQREKDKLIQVYDKLSEDNIGIAVVYVNLSKDNAEKSTSIEQIKSYLSDSKFNFPTFIDYDDELQEALSVSSVPTNIILDKNAIIKGHTEEIDMDNLILDNQTEFRLDEK